MASNQYQPVDWSSLPGVTGYSIEQTGVDTEGRTWPLDMRFSLGGKKFRVSAPQRGVNFGGGGFLYSAELEELKSIVQKSYFVAFLFMVRDSRGIISPHFIQEYRVQGVNSDMEWPAAIKKERAVWVSVLSRTFEVFDNQTIEIARIQEQ